VHEIKNEKGDKIRDEHLSNFFIFLSVDSVRFQSSDINAPTYCRVFLSNEKYFFDAIEYLLKVISLGIDFEAKK